MLSIFLNSIFYVLCIFQLSTEHVVTYYITNSTSSVHNRSCYFNGMQLNSCLTLEMLAEEFRISSAASEETNVSILFLHEMYSVHEDIGLSFSRRSMVTLKPWNNIDYVTLYCIEDFYIKYTRIQVITVESMNFYNCGMHKPVITCSDRIEAITLINTSFIRSAANSVRIFCEIMKFEALNCLFSNAIKTYAVLISSIPKSVSFLNSTFSDNPAGSVYCVEAINTTLTLFGCIFKNNSSPTKSQSNSIQVTHSKVKLLIENCTFLKNNLGPAILINVWEGYQTSMFPGTLYVINSKFYEHEGQVGALAISSDYNISIFKSNFTSCSATSENGSAMNFLRTKNIHIENCYFKSSTATHGGALYILSSNATILNSVFFNNSATSEGGAVYASLSDLILTNITFQYNRGTHAGAIRIRSGKTITSSCSFVNNEALQNGGSLLFTDYFGSHIFLNYSFIHIYNSSFTSNEARLGGAIYVTKFDSLDGSHPKVVIHNSVLINNSAEIGGALSITHIQKKLYLSNLLFKDNRGFIAGGALSFNMVNCLDSVLYNCNFVSNIVSNDRVKFGFGGAIAVQNSTLMIAQIKFMKNEANNGGAIYCNKTYISTSDLTIMHNKAYLNGGGVFLSTSKLRINGTLTFINNEVIQSTGKGKAVYVMDKQEECRANSCSLLWTNNSKVNFENELWNNAPLLYGGMIHTCHNIHQVSSLIKTIGVNGKQYSDIDDNIITSSAVKFCLCQSSYMNCKKREWNEMVIPGHSFNISVVCTDQIYQIIPCDITSTYTQTGIQLGQGQSFRHITTCETLPFNAYTKKLTSSTLLITGLIFCTDSLLSTLKIHINIEPCPLGFQLTDGKCSCDDRLINIFDDIECDINNQQITIKRPGWLSFAGGYLRAYKNCPLNFCDSVKKVIQPSHPDTQCRNNRGGVLCGRCVSNYSVVLGSWNCRQCSNLSRYNFLWLTILMALAGVVLVVFLLLLKITVSTGAINGLLLYANLVSSSGLLDHQHCTLNSGLRVFLSWVNLDLGIEVCFYSGMDVYQKSWLQFLFPFYIWFLVGVIIFICHYSSTVMKLMGRRNIEVLATLFLISYSKLLKSVVSSLNFTDIYVASADNQSDSLSQHRVWLYDGNILFFSKQHLPLFTVSFIFFIILFLPYTLVLLFGQFLMSLPPKKGLYCLQNSFFTSMMDAYHAPYTKHHRYWTGLGLLIRCCLFTIFATSYNVKSNMLWLLLAIVLLLVIKISSSSKIYRKKILTLFELAYLVNLLVLAVLIIYSEKVCVILTSSASLSLVIFIIIVLYHAHAMMLNNTNWYHILQQFIEQVIKIKMSNLKKSKETTEEVKDNAKSSSTSYFELRESLIAD